MSEQHTPQIKTNVERIAKRTEHNVRVLIWEDDGLHYEEPADTIQEETYKLLTDWLGEPRLEIKDFVYAVLL